MTTIKKPSYHYLLKVLPYTETLLNYNREEGETLLTPQGWLNEVNVREELNPTNAAKNDKPNPNDWAGKTSLKALTSRLYGKVYHTFMIKPHLAAFRNVWSLESRWISSCS